jgi:hypothetical protein
MHGTLKRTVSTPYHSPCDVKTKTRKTGDFIDVENKVATKHMVKWLDLYKTETDFDHVVPCGSDEITTLVWMDKKNNSVVNAIHYLTTENAVCTPQEPCVYSANEFLQSQYAIAAFPGHLCDIDEKFKEGAMLSSVSSVDTFTLSDGADCCESDGEHCDE